MDLRSRSKKHITNDELKEPWSRDESKTKTSKYANFFPAIFTISLLSWGYLLYLLGFYFNDKLPYAVDIATHSDDIKSFNGKRALTMLEHLSDIGPKVTGTIENEVLAVDLITEKIREIMSSASPTHEIKYDLQKVNGSFKLAIFNREYYKHYVNVQNIVVKIGPRIPKHNISLLINCHFDSVPASPGSSDDGLNCVVMLEILRLLSTAERELPINIVFLFNGAEEAMLLASHGFITQHPWAREVKVFVNLESCGAGGKEILFQSGPGHPWLIKKYAESALHPSGSVLAAEIFQSGLVPSDTDFRIFKDFGHLSGLDFAHCGNGYVYHTAHDRVKNIANVFGVLQHTGDNILKLIESIVWSQEIYNEENNKTQRGDQIYFDFLGILFFEYSSAAANLINTSIGILSMLVVLLTLFKMNRGQNLIKILMELLTCIFLHIGVLITALLYNVIVGYVLDQISCSMSWYTYSFWIVPLYFMPPMTLKMVSCLILNSNQRLWFASLKRAQTILLSSLFIWSVCLLIGTAFDLRSTYIILIQVLPFTIVCTSLLILRVYKRGLVWLGISCTSTIISSVYLAYVAVLAFRVFLPIAGRTGADKNPEFIVGLLATLLAFMIFDYSIPLILLVNEAATSIILMCLLHGMAILFITVTPLGFPYGSSELMPSPQRLIVQHSEIIHYDKIGNIESRDGGFEIEVMDRQGFNNLPSLIKQRGQLKRKTTCYHPTNEHLFWIKSDPPTIKKATSVDLHSVKVNSNVSTRFYFNVTGSNNMIIEITVLSGKLKAWSMDEGIPKPCKFGDIPETYLIHHIQGLGNHVWLLWLDLEGSPGEWEEETIKIKTTAFHAHGNGDYSTQFLEIFSAFENWTHVSAFITSHKVYIF